LKYEIKGSLFACWRVYDILRTFVPGPKHPLVINYLTCLVSTMVSSGFGPYHGMSLEDAQTKCIGIIPTPCAMTHVLGLVQFPPQQE